MDDNKYNPFFENENKNENNTTSAELSSLESLNTPLDPEFSKAPIANNTFTIENTPPVIDTIVSDNTPLEIATAVSENTSPAIDTAVSDNTPLEIVTAVSENISPVIDTITSENTPLESIEQSIKKSLPQNIFFGDVNEQQNIFLEKKQPQEYNASKDIFFNEITPPKTTFFSENFQPNNVNPQKVYNEGPAATTQCACKSQKKPLTLGLILIILIPILILTNILTSLFAFNYAWQDAQSTLEQDINAMINKENNLPVDSQLLAYNVSKAQLPSVLEITSNASNGQSSGTGFIISDEGYILTNAHVVTYAKSAFGGIGPSATIVNSTVVAEDITVRFADNDTSYPITVVAYDTDLDLAVCKFNVVPTNLVPVTFADSTLLSYGEPCIAIGNAQGYGLATTEGVISAPIQYYKLTSRDEALTSAVQHSAAINPGNSGGPLFNMYGQVIGINSFKLTGNSDLAIDGMGFAIPTAVAKDYVNGLRIDGLTIKYTETPKLA